MTGPACSFVLAAGGDALVCSPFGCPLPLMLMPVTPLPEFDEATEYRYRHC